MVKEFGNRINTKWTAESHALKEKDLFADDIDNGLVILPLDPDELIDTEDIDDSSTRKIKETVCDEQYIIYQ
ncbi:hypothetical protein AVEN_212579-1 [Araneus ventricosus]|uniref:Uncharacterized protein n=1 Tax=Araneus ventricosus TaxID=182803 RepID=A0A4Y2LNQ7_ARAVE|nr:hypothetical protein AVEN_212579-1 [Araneus ventricosus]